MFSAVGELRTGGMDEEGIPLLVVIGLIAVDGVEREGGDKLHTLPHHIGQTDVVGFVVIGCDGENAFGQGVHHILGGGLEDDVPDKVFWKRAVVGELGGKRRRAPSPWEADRREAGKRS